MDGGFKRPITSSKRGQGGSRSTSVNKAAHNKSNRSSKAQQSNGDAASGNKEPTKGEDIQLSNPQPFLDFTSHEGPAPATGGLANDPQQADQDEALVIKVADHQDIGPGDGLGDRLEEEKTPELRVAINKEDVEMIDEKEAKSLDGRPQIGDEDAIPTFEQEKLRPHPDAESRASRASKQSKSSWSKSAGVNPAAGRSVQAEEQDLSEGLPPSGLSVSNKVQKAAKREKSKSAKAKAQEKPSTVSKTN